MERSCFVWSDIGVNPFECQKKGRLAQHDDAKLRKN